MRVGTPASNNQQKNLAEEIMMKRLCGVLVVAWSCAGPVAAGEPATLNDRQFEEQLRGLKAERNETEKHRLARQWLSARPLSSLQVKAIAAHLNDENARLEFAAAAYPRTVDPENFYEVYDAFTTFSKVMRLHDRIQLLRQLPPPPAPVVVVPPSVTEAELKDILRAIRKEPFENTRSQMARQIVSSSRKQFLSSQIKDILGCFDFEPTRLEFAKFAYDYTLDQERYFLVNEAFSFSSSKDTLTRYLESKRPPSPPPGPRR
jgi:hypothetical protein